MSRMGPWWEPGIMRALRASSVFSFLVFFAGSVQAEPAGGELIVEARLVDVVEAPRCGRIHSAATARYEVVRVIQGEYEGNVLYAIHDCSGLTRRDLGAVHRLVLVRGRAGVAVVFDTFADQSAPRLWVRRFEVVVRTGDGAN